MTPSLDSGSLAVSDEPGPWAAFFGSSFIVLAAMLGFAVVWTLPVIVAVPVLGLCFGALLLTSGRTLRRMPIPLAWLTYVGWVLSSLTWTGSPETADFILKRDVIIWIGFLMIGGLLPWRTIVNSLVKFSWLALAITIFAIATSAEARIHIDPAGLSPAYPGWHGFFDHKNSMSPVLVFMLVTILQFDKSPITRSLSFAAIAVLLVGSTSATGIAVSIIALVALGWINYVRRLNKRLAPPFVAMSFMMMITVALGSFFSLRAIVQTAGRDLTFTGRTDIWVATIHAIERQPWTGYGMGGLFSSPPTAVTERVNDEVGFIVPHAHSGILDLVAQYGVIGGLLFLVMLGSWVSSSMKVRYIAVDLAAWNLVVALCLVVVSLSEAVFEAGWVGLIGMATAMNIRLVADHKRALIAAQASSVGSGQWRIEQRI